MPTFLFESVLCLIAFLLLLFIRRGKYVKVGQPTALYLMAYGGIRFFIEMSRTDSLMLGGFKMAQIISVIFFIVGISMIAYTSKKSKFEDLYNDPSNVDEIRF
jgi:phosphatidylglycerol:prolipoprotein diacylglycerol transferase